MHPYLAAALIGIALAAVITGIQCLAITLTSRARRRAYRQQRERERPYREVERAIQQARMAAEHLAHVEQLRLQGLLGDHQADQLSETTRAEMADARRTIERFTVEARDILIEARDRHP